MLILDVAASLRRRPFGIRFGLVGRRRRDRRFLLVHPLFGMVHRDRRALRRVRLPLRQLDRCDRLRLVDLGAKRPQEVGRRPGLDQGRRREEEGRPAQGRQGRLRRLGRQRLRDLSVLSRSVREDLRLISRGLVRQGRTTAFVIGPSSMASSKARRPQPGTSCSTLSPRTTMARATRCVPPLVAEMWRLLMRGFVLDLQRLEQEPAPVVA